MEAIPQSDILEIFNNIEERQIVRRGTRMKGTRINCLKETAMSK
jgi:hypothetical protein